MKTMEVSEQQLMQMFKETFERLKAAGVYEDFYIPEDGDMFSQCWCKAGAGLQTKSRGILQAIRALKEDQVRYTIVIEKGTKSGFVAHCPVLKGCVSQGATERKALANLREAMQDYLDTLAEDGLPLPAEVGRHYVDLELPDFYQEQILARAAKLTQPEILQILLQIQKKYSSERHPTENSQMCMLWPTDDLPDVLECTEPLDEIKKPSGFTSRKTMPAKSTT